MKNSTILLSPCVRNRLVEGTILGTPLPGQAIMLANQAADGGGEMTYVVYQPNANGDPRQKIILLEDWLQGMNYQMPYKYGSRFQAYCPLPGDEMNILVAGQVGTGSADAIYPGERLIPEAGSGLFLQTAVSSANAWFVAKEHIVAHNQNKWVWSECA